MLITDTLSPPFLLCAYSPAAVHTSSRPDNDLSFYPLHAPDALPTLSPFFRDPPRKCFPKCASSRALQPSQASKDQMPNPIQQHHTPYYDPRQLQNRDFIPRRSHAREACSGAFERRGEGGECVGLDGFVSGIARVRLRGGGWEGLGL
jgi:hypothetical protein